MSGWYYVDPNEAQFGPVDKNDIKAAWDTKKIDGECICWNEEMADWMKISELPDLLAFLSPPAAAPRGAPPKGGPAAPAPAPAPSAPAPKGPAPSSSSALPFGGWKEMRTVDGQTYYFNQASNQTTWDKPEELKTEADREKEGEWYWVPHPDQAYVPARKMFSQGDQMKLEDEQGNAYTVKGKEMKKLERMYWVQLNQLAEDLVLLDAMNRPLILYNLKRRFEQFQIYTRIGTILVSFNPYKSLPLYTPSVIEDYIKRGKRKLPPHIFEIADNAFNNLREHELGQSIVISGESGAGKTECTKQCLQYLAEIAGSSTNNVEQRILLSNPILEAFGNAKTMRNNNSSRFGKYMGIFFDGRFNICGAQVTNYLLEKIRVVFQAKEERNYHIFYQLVKAADEKQRAALKLSKKCEDYNYLSQSGCTEIEGLDDKDEFKEVLEAFDALGFANDEIQNLFKVIAGVLHLGNVDIKSSGDRKSSVSSPAPLANAAALLQIEPAKLESAVITRLMQLKGQAPIVVGLSKDEAVAARDALAKFIYEQQFDWLVLRINKSIGKGNRQNENYSIGILDIFGFEIFEKNQFEQLCINFTNEKLQQMFNQNTFKKEEAVYTQEKIKFSHVEYIDNQPVLDLIEKKPNGILLMVDEELRVPQGSDKTFIAKLLTAHKDTKEFQRVVKSADMFMVHHYAGDVSYEVTGFLEKNKDRLNEDAYDLLAHSKFSFLQQWFTDDRSDMSSSARKATLGSKFMKQLNDLMSALATTEPHYVRCVKPNPNKAPIQFYGKMCLDQLEYAGVFEAVQIRKQGFPFRLTHEDFWKRYKCIFPQDHKWGKNHVSNCEVLIKEMKQSFETVQIGTSMVLYRAEQHRAMELRRNLAVEKVTIFIQKFARQKLAELLQKRCEGIRPVLAKAVASRNIEQLDVALGQAANVGFDLYETLQAKRMKHIFLEEKRLEQVFVILAQQDPHEYFEEFQKEVGVADDIGLTTPLANQCRAKYKEAVIYRQAIDRDATEQKSVLNEQMMKDILDRADAIRYSTTDIENLRTLLYETAETDFVKMQLKAAVKHQDKERVVGKTIRLKELFFEKAGDMFRFRNYPKLYPNMEWAGLKLLPFGREELAIGMLKWTKDPIHAPLSQLPKPKDKEVNMSKLAVKMFKNVLGYMGERKYQSPNILAQELLQTCLDHRDLRDEIYCQLIKQLTENPTGTVSKGWDLMTLCMATFPPNSEMENYLEIFLRTKGNPPSKFVNLLHETLYGGARRSAPSENEMSQILGQSEVKRNVASLPREEAIRIPPPMSPARLPERISPDFGGRGAPPKGPAPGAPAAAGGPPPGGPRGGPPGGPGPRGPPPAAAAPPKPKEPEMDQGLEWHYIDTENNQQGPVNVAQLRNEWRGGRVDGECLVWNPDMPDWKVVNDLPDLKAYLVYH